MEQPDPQIADSLIDLIGDTPLVRLNRVTEGLACTVVAKLEMLNPGGSVKDRPALAMIEQVERDDPQSYYSVAERLVRETPGAFRPNQYGNEWNPWAHEQTTGPEIWRQTAGRITHFVAGGGPGGANTGGGPCPRARRPGGELLAGGPPGA